MFNALDTLDTRLSGMPAGAGVKRQPTEGDTKVHLKRKEQSEKKSVLIKQEVTEIQLTRLER